MASTTRFLISNLHCPSCVQHIETTLLPFRPSISSLSTSVVSQTLTITHDNALSPSVVAQALEEVGFEIHSVARCHGQEDIAWEDGPDKDDRCGPRIIPKGYERWRSRPTHQDTLSSRRRTHAERCDSCRAAEKVSRGSEAKSEQASPSALDGELASVVSPPPAPVQRAVLAVVGMSCSSCVGKITEVLEAKSWITAVNVNLLASSATVEFRGIENLSEIVHAIEEIGYEASVQELDQPKDSGLSKPSENIRWKAVYSIEGMTCSSCVGNISSSLDAQSWIEAAEVSLISKSATVTITDEAHAKDVLEIISEAGYDAHLESLVQESSLNRTDSGSRTVVLLVDGMHCEQCPQRVLDSLKTLEGFLRVDEQFDLKHSKLKITYSPHPPDFTIREILAHISAVDSTFKVSIYHPPTLEERARELHRRTQLRTLYRLVLSFIVSIPTLIIGIIYMTLVPSDNATRNYLMHPMWAGNVSRAEWALFFMTTPVYFFAADIFHRRAIKEIWALWRPRSRTPLLRRFYKFGSMDMLMSLGTTIAYFASITELAINASMARGMDNGEITTYFDVVVFLTFFLLCGRLIEAYSKAKSGNAVSLLGSLRPTEAFLLEGGEVKPIPTDHLENGDIVRVKPGCSPPSDGVIVEGQTNVDESSLTGEARPVKKAIGDEVFAGTINQSAPVSVRISGVGGRSMLDQIIKAVREGQTRRAPIEKLADILTGYFVPVITLVAIVVWIIWLTLGLTGSLPRDYLDVRAGGWAFWSLQFAIAVFVIACPCGIGLAAPTAIFVGTGLAAKYGILVKAGGEAFQLASKVDRVVFDKTGTLTEGGNPVITDFLFSEGADQAMLLGIAKAIEENSGHPLAKAVVNFASSKEAVSIEVSQVAEMPGKGMKGSAARGATSNQPINIIIGNETLLHEYLPIPEETVTTLERWKREAKTVILVATQEVPQDQSLPWNLVLIMAASDRIRPEAPQIVRTLQAAGVDTWMLSGDSPATAQAVAAAVGIAPDHVIAGVLPDQKASKINSLQQHEPEQPSKRWLSRQSEPKSRRPIVAMVGDGINDAPALTAADVGIAVGSGADIAVAAADIVLVATGLHPLVTALELSRKVFQRVKFNFAWALVYNMIGVPVAAGVLYPIVSNGGHIRLNPVWASLAMALSSISVVSSSLTLRSKIPGLGFRPSNKLVA